MNMNQTISPVSQLDDAALDLLFREARSFSFWQPRPIDESVIRNLYDLLKFGPTSANTSPARFVFLTSDEAKARLVAPVPFPKRMGRPEEFGHLVRVLIENDYMNAEVVRFDGGIRFQPK